VQIEDKRKALYNAKKLAGIDKFANIYISPDLTRKQQELEKKLRDKFRALKGEGLTNIKINRGKIIQGEGHGMKVLYDMNN